MLIGAYLYSDVSLMEGGDKREGEKGWLAVTEEVSGGGGKVETRIAPDQSEESEWLAIGIIVSMSCPRSTIMIIILLLTTASPGHDVGVS